MKTKKYFVKTYGCQANKADSENIAGVLEGFGARKVRLMKDADIIVINTCSIRQQAEDKVYGMIENVRKLKEHNPDIRLVVSGCMIGEHADKPRDTAIAKRLGIADKLIGTADYLGLQSMLKDLFPETKDEYLSSNFHQIREEKDHAWVLISSGCNNFCTFCIVPYARGREKSRSFEDIVGEVKRLGEEGYKHITLLGQNVNSYGSDLVAKSRKAYEEGQPAASGDWENIGENEYYTLPGGEKVRPIMVSSLGRVRIPTLFPYLLDEVCKVEGIEKVDFISSNPWDFSDELISTIAKNNKISRFIHLPVQSGDNKVLKKMNRWYTKEEYLNLVGKIKDKVGKDVEFGTDIIVGFPGESEEAFQNTVDLCKQVGFKVAFIGKYSPRVGTVSARFFKDEISLSEKKRRFEILDEIVNR